MTDALFQTVLRVADDHLILGHRLSEWCGHAPMLEEDLALPNIALDLLGQARALYTYAAELDGTGKTEDDYAYLRREREYRNLLLVERPNGDFGHTMLRQLFFSTYQELWWAKACASSDATIAGIAAKAVKESAYHVRHAAEWTIRLGDGTEESAARMANAVADLAPYIDEMFLANAETDALPDPSILRADWDARIDHVFSAAMLQMPETVWAVTGGREGRHGEEMGHLLTELQYMQRSFPGAQW